MATRLAAWPGGLQVFDLRDDAMAPLLEAGADAAASVAELGGTCDVVSVMVLDDDQVRSVVTELLTTASAGSIIAVHSTIRAETAEALAEVAAAARRRPARRTGERRVHGCPRRAPWPPWSAGSAPPTSEPRPVFEQWASLVVHMGPAGAGTRTKLARNLLHFIAFTAAAEAQRLAEAAGLDLRKLARVVRHSDAVTGGPGRDHDPRHHGPACSLATTGTTCSSHTREPGGEGPDAGAGDGRRARGSSSPSPAWRCGTSRPGLGVPYRLRRRAPRSRRRTWRGCRAA